MSIDGSKPSSGSSGTSTPTIEDAEAGYAKIIGLATSLAYELRNTTRNQHKILAEAMADKKNPLRPKTIKALKEAEYEIALELSEVKEELKIAEQRYRQDNPRKFGISFRR